MSEPHGRFVVVPAAYVFLLRDGAAGPEVLLQLRQNTGYMDDHWAAAAAGHVEQGETAYDAAHREALRGDRRQRPRPGVRDAMQRTRGGEPIDERVDFFFTARSWSGEPRIVEPTKGADLAGARSTRCPTRWCRTSSPCWTASSGSDRVVHHLRLRPGDTDE